MLELIEDLGMRKDDKTSRRWCLAKCSFCGETKEHRTQSLKTKQSCGCATYLKAHIKHGCFKDRLYQIWADMKTRCNQPNNPRYYRYGGRGIKVTEEWNSFEPFKEWAESNGYNDYLTIDRINNDGDYTPNNCEWITIQENLKRRNTYQGWKNGSKIN
jgi:hypothetical protein